MANLSIVYPFYNNHAAMDDLKPRLCKTPCDIVIVDDASKVPLTVECPNVRVIRIEVDVPWNQPAASNLGIKSLSPDDIVLRLDIDHWVEPEEFESFRKAADRIPKRTLLQFRRRQCDEKIMKPNMNMLMMRVSDFMQIGGYDEDFCGSYGYDDREFVERARHKGFSVSVYQDAMLCLDANSGTKSLSRDTSINKQKYLLKRKEMTSK